VLYNPLHDKLRTENKGRPNQLLPNLMNYCTTKTAYKTCCRFQYEKFDWLSGCEKTKKKLIVGPVYVFRTNMKLDRGGTLVKVLFYKSEGRWFAGSIPDGVIGIFH